MFANGAEIVIVPASRTQMLRADCRFVTQTLRSVPWRFFVVKLRLRDNENVNDAVKRFRKLVEHAGIKREMRKREYYEKPSDEARRDRRRAAMRIRSSQRTPNIGG